jgi:SNF2 family DNA or RNA helicase
MAEGDAQEQSAEANSTVMDVGAAMDGIDGDEDGLFVEQLGEVREVNNSIDLTQETQAQSDARALRVHLRPVDDSDPKIKQEEDDEDPVLKDTDDDYEEDSDATISDEELFGRRPPKKKKAARPRKAPDNDIDMPDCIEDAEDMLNMLSAERNILKRREANNTLKTGDATRLKEVGRLIASVETRVRELTEGDDESSSLVDETCSVSSMAVAPPSPKVGQKRKNTAQSGPGAATKKLKPSAPLPTRRARKKAMAGDDAAKLILEELLQNRDAIAAGQEMADLPLLDGFNATTVKEQDRLFHELTSKNPDADKRQIRGDLVELDRARKALTRRYKVAGEKYQITGMKTSLFPYQFAAAGWMVGREKSIEEPHGGILADAMGLGKTVETLACIAGNPPSEEDLINGYRTTLVIVKATAVAQWVGEIYKHGDGIAVAHYKRSDVIGQAALNHSSIW